MADHEQSSSPYATGQLPSQWSDLSSGEDTSDDLDMDLDSQSEDDLTTLSDSTFEIISHSSLHTSDEEIPEDGTESLLSFGIPTPEEGSSVDGDDYLSPRETYQHDLQPPVLGSGSNQDRALDEAVPTSPPLDISSLEKSDLSTITTSTVTDSVEEWINFKDPIRGVASGLINVCTSSNQPEADEGFPKPKMAVRMTLSNKTFEAKSSFRIIFYTCHQELVALKEPILEKIGQALFLSRTSRAGEQRSVMNVVPISAFDDRQAEPDVVLVPSTGVQLQVDDCSQYSLFTKGCHKRIHFYSKSGCVVRSHKAKFPDLFVFVHTGPDRPLHRLISSLSMSESLKRRGVPVLDICAQKWIPDSLYVTANDVGAVCSLPVPFRPWRGRAVHVVHSIPDFQGRYAEHAMPIDHDALQLVDPVDLNSNIGVITDTNTLASRFWSAVQHEFKANNFFAPMRWIVLLGVLFALVLAPVIVSYPSLAPKLIWLPGLSACQNKAGPTASSATVGNAPAQTQVVQRTLPPPVAPLLISAPKLSTKTKALTRVSPSHNPCMASKIHKSSSMQDKGKKTPEFQILEAPDGRLYLQARKSLPRKWKPSTNFIHAVQGDTPLESSFSTINDTTFELHLGESRSCSPIIVTVWPHQGETSSQTFQLSRPCPSRATFQSIADAYTKTFVDASSSMMLTTFDLFTFMQQQGSDLYSRNVEYVMQQSAWHSHQIGNMAHTSLQRVHQLNNKVETARMKFNSRADEQMNNIGKYMKSKFQEIGNDVTGIEQNLGSFVVNVRNRAARAKAANDQAQRLVYQQARTGIEKFRNGMHCGTSNMLPAFVCQRRWPQKAPFHVKRAKARANSLKDRVARCGGRLRERR